MTRKLNPAEVSLDGEVQEAILSLTLVTQSGETRTLGNLVSDALRNLAEVNTFLQTSPLIRITAENLMRTEKRRGVPTIRISGEGEVLLHLSWGEEQLPEPLEKLPTLDVLREKARSMGIDISDLGRQKRNIIQRLSEASC
jgi:hypothetical protein